MRDWSGPKLPRWVAPVGVLVLSSAVAGLATAPYAAAHFNRFTDYGLIANLLSVPLMGALVMPAAVAAVVLAPFGLSWLALQAMGLGLAWILAVADWITSLEGAITPVVAPGPWVLPLLSFGALVLILWRGGLRWLDMECLGRFEKAFIDCTSEQQLQVVEDIAYPLDVKPGLEQGTAFFNRLRDLVATGFFTSEMGVEDLGYAGNMANDWQGPPPEVLRAHGF